MAQNYDKVDCFWTSRGDMMIGGNGDIQDTAFDPLRSLVQEIHTRIEADMGDWATAPSVGGNLRDFVGEPNNSYTAEAIKVRIISCLTKDGFINNADLKVKYMPIDREKIMFRLTVQVRPTAANGNSRSLVINTIYNYSDNNVYFF